MFAIQTLHLMFGDHQGSWRKTRAPPGRQRLLKENMEEGVDLGGAGIRGEIKYGQNNLDKLLKKFIKTNL